MRTPTRRSYRRLSSLPAYGLYVGPKLAASVRASSQVEAIHLFDKHGLKGDRVRRVNQ